MRQVLSRLFPFLLLVLVLASAYFIPLSLPAYLDFQVLYHADMGLLRGISLYDRAGQVEMIAEIAGVGVDQVFVLPFPYPPWVALVAIPLAYLPISTAVRMWFAINFSMLVLSIWLLTDGWQPPKRLITILAAIFFMPVLGALYVGQYVFPVLLGWALTGYALRNGKPILVGAAVALLTFKPHLGGLMLIALIIYMLAYRNRAFSRLSLFAIGLVGLILISAGYFVDRSWPGNYLSSLREYGALSGVNSCGLCASLPIEMVRWTGGEGIGLAVLYGGILLIILGAGMYGKRQALLQSPDNLVPVMVLMTLLTSPYLLNYDYVLLVIPILAAVGIARTTGEWAWVLVAYGLPWLGLSLMGRQGNVSLVLATILLAAITYYQMQDRKMLDAPSSRLYNQQN